MKLFTSKKNSRLELFPVLCLAVCMQISGVPSLPHLAAPEASLSSIESATASSSTKSSAIQDALKNPVYKDPISQKLLLHLATSPMADKLGFEKEVRTFSKPDLGGGLKIAESVEAFRTNQPDFPRNALQLQIYGRNGEVKPEISDKMEADTNAALEKEEKSTDNEAENLLPGPDPVVNQILEKMWADTNGAKEKAAKYARAAAAGHYAVITDNEADDLSYFAKSFEDKIIPKFIIVYGGFVELRYNAVLRFIKSACAHHGIPPENEPKVYRGFPQFSTRQDRARAYDWEEGKRYLTDRERVQYIKESIDIETTLQGDKPNTWIENAWQHPIFKEGLDALRNLFRENDYSAVAVLSSPAALTYLIREDPSRAKKIGITMSSPYGYVINEKGVQYIDTYNSRQQLPLTNELLKSGVDILGVGGGTAKTRGLRNLHDARVGRNGEKLYPDVGLKYLEEVVSPDSPFEMYRIIYHAGHNFSTAKWRDWDETLAKLWKYMSISEPSRPGTEELRKRPQEIVDLQNEIAAKARKTEGKETDAASSSRSGQGEKTDDNPEKGDTAMVTESQEAAEKETPQAATWDLDRLLNTMRMWYLFGHKVRWQGPSADLHALITLPPYTEGLIGAVRYGVEDWPVTLDKEGKPAREKLVKFVLSDHSNHYSVSDMKFVVIVDGFQGMLVRTHDQMLKIRQELTG